MPKPITSEEYARAVQELETYDDRSAAIVAGTILEDSLRTALEYCFQDDKRHIDSLFDGYGPLGTFSARIDVAYALGLFGPFNLKSLHIIRRVRNEFAHTLSASFQQPKIVGLCRELAVGGDIFFIADVDLRLRYLRSVFFLSQHIPLEAACHHRPSRTGSKHLDD